MMTDNIPFNYNYINVYNELNEPSTIHAYNSGLTQFFIKYLTERAMSVYKWKLPKSVNPYYFKWVLFTYGFIGLFKHEVYGNMALACSFEGYTAYYYPKYALFTNPVFGTDIVKKEIDKDCILLNAKGDFTGYHDIVSFYAEQLAILYESFGVNAIQAKNTDIYGTENKKTAEELKKVTDMVISGKPAVFTTSDLFDKDTKQILVQQFKQAKDYFGTELLDNILSITKNFDHEIGLPTANTGKRERLITNEVDSEKFYMSRAQMWLDDLKNECKKARKLLGFDIDVDFRYNIDDISKEVTDNV